MLKKILENKINGVHASVIKPTVYLTINLSSVSENELKEVRKELKNQSAVKISLPEATTMETWVFYLAEN